VKLHLFLAIFTLNIYGAEFSFVDNGERLKIQSDGEVFFLKSHSIQTQIEELPVDLSKKSFIKAQYINWRKSFSAETKTPNHFFQCH
jgi:hypothetical protein